MNNDLFWHRKLLAFIKNLNDLFTFKKKNQNYKTFCKLKATA